jgi:hypothetical protein
MSRRRLVNYPGLSSLLPALSLGRMSLASSPNAQRDGRARVDLNGVWERHADHALLDAVHVPSSRHALGFYRLKHNFQLPRLARGEGVSIRSDGLERCMQKRSDVYCRSARK